MKWLLLILSLPTNNATARMRAWRRLKASGAAVLRDGVYLLPAREGNRPVFEAIVQDVQSSGGSARLLHIAEDDAGQFIDLFDRSQDYSSLLDSIAELQASVSGDQFQEGIKQLRKLRKAFVTLAAIDYFPGQIQQQTQQALENLESHLHRLLSPGEPAAASGEIPRLDIRQYRKRTWATRARPWIDRLASAWLIRRFIDTEAKLLWLATPGDCPEDALGFDFDGASFSHSSGKVTFEVLLTSFALELPALQRLGAVIHYLDVGGGQPPSEASGLEQILWGLRNSIADDDQLLAAASCVFDALFTSYSEKISYDYT